MADNPFQGLFGGGGPAPQVKSNLFSGIFDTKFAPPARPKTTPKIADLQALYRAGKLTRSQFAQAIAVRTKSPTRVTLGQKLRDIGGGTALGAARTGIDVAQFIPRSVAGLEATAVQGATGKSQVIHPRTGLAKALLGAQPIQSAQVRGAQAAATHPGGFHIPGTNITLSPAATAGAATGLGFLQDVGGVTGLKSLPKIPSKLGAAVSKAKGIRGTSLPAEVPPAKISTPVEGVPKTAGQGTKIPVQSVITDTTKLLGPGKKQLSAPGPSEVIPGARGGVFGTTAKAGPRAAEVKAQLAEALNVADKKLAAVQAGKAYATPQQLKDLFSTRQRLAAGDETALPGYKAPSAPKAPAAPKITAATAPIAPTTVKPTAVPSGGPTKTSKLATGVEAKAVQNKLTKSLGDLPQYEQVSMKEQAGHATNLLANDEQRAIRIATGREEPPSHILPEAVFTAVENKALKEGNVDLIKQLAHSTRTGEATVMGQRIRALAERNPDSPVAHIQSILDTRAKAVESRLKQPVAQAVKSTAKEIKTAVTPPSKAEWSNFIESIKC